MPSKLTFALVALLAATSSVSAMPMPMPGTPAQAPPPPDASALNAPLQPTTGGLQQPPAVQTPQQPLQGVAPPHSHSHSHLHPHSHEHLHALNAATGPVPPHTHHTHHNHHHHKALAQPVPPLTAAPVVGGPTAGAPVPPVNAGPAPVLQAREFYESYVEDLMARDPFSTENGEHHHHHHHPHEGHFGHHHPHNHHNHHHADASADPSANAAAAVPAGPTPDGTVSPQRREVLERRGFLEAIGLKAYQKDLTKKQNELLKKAEDECNALPHSSKKDKNKCLDAVKHITKLTKERNHYVEEFTKKTGKHDLFPYADPDYKGEFFKHPSSSSSSMALVQPPSPYGYPYPPHM